MGTFKKKISAGKICGGGLLKIFLTVGTKDYPFDRIVRAMDKKGVFMQIGNSTAPKFANYKRFMSKQEVYEKMDWADVVVCHAGTGTVMEVIDLGKRIVVVPRQKRFHEHIDDHQVEFSHYLKTKFDINSILDENKVWTAIEKSTTPKNVGKESELISEIKKVINK